MDEGDSHTCLCTSGYTGSYCDVEIDECASNPCQHGSTCSDKLGTYLCTCTAGFQGQNCEINIDDCKTSPCQNGGKLTFTVRGIHRLGFIIKSRLRFNIESRLSFIIKFRLWFIIMSIEGSNLIL